MSLLIIRPSAVGVAGDDVDQQIGRTCVAGHTFAHHVDGGDVADVRIVTEFLACVHVRDVDLGDRQREKYTESM